MSNMKFCMERSSAAMSKYTPIAGKVFGADFIDPTCKHALASCLVDSSLLYMCQVKSMRCRELRRINTTFMRVVRNIHGCSRYNAEAEADITVRRAHCIPSVDCLLVRKRLAYFARLARSECTLLKFLLALRFEVYRDHEAG